MGRVERLGVLGGTFDPIHIGHLLMAQAAYEQLGLDLVLFVPAGVPPHKRKQEREDASARLAMTRAAIAGDERFALSLVDIERPAPHYTVDMLRLLGRQYGLGPECIHFIVGSDSLAQLHTWHQPGKVARECILSVLRRPGFPIALEELFARVPEARGRVHLVEMPEVGVSSTLLRSMVRQGRLIRYWVPPAVEQMVREQGLYLRAPVVPAGEVG